MPIFSYVLQIASAIAVPQGVLPPSETAVPIPLSVTERPRGSIVSTASGGVFGVVDTSEADRVVLIVGDHKVQVPASAIRKDGGRLTTRISPQQVNALLAASASYQKQSNPDPKPVPAPKNFVPIK